MHICLADTQYKLLCMYIYYTFTDVVDSIYDDDVKHQQIAMCSRLYYQLMPVHHIGAKFLPVSTFSYPNEY